MRVKISVQFDEYEAALLRRAKKELTIVAKRKGNKPPSIRDVVRGAVRMGIHSIYGEEFVSDDLLEQSAFGELVENDLSQLED